jgi:hypothetical protein
VTYKEWNDLIQKSFEKLYYVPAGSFFLLLSAPSFVY